MPPQRRSWPAGVVGEHGAVHRMRDDTELVADIFRPAHRGQLPVLLMRLPYDREVAEVDVGVAHPSWFAAQGFVVVVQDVRGTGASAGEFDPFRHEAADGIDSIAWAASLDGSDGRVFTYGSSYMGLSQLLVAASRPHALAGIAPSFASSGAHEGWITDAGAVNLGFVAMWSLQMAAARAVRVGDIAAQRVVDDALKEIAVAPERLAERWSDLVDDPALDRCAPWVRQWWRHRHEPRWWAAWDVTQRYQQVAVPGWHAAGVHDIFAHGTIGNFGGLRERAATPWARQAQRLVVGPWSHDPSADTAAGAAAAVSWLDDQWLAWVGDVVAGREPATPAVTVWLDTDGWRGFDGWPPREATNRTWYLQSGGRAQSRYGDGQLVDHPAPDGYPADVLVDLPDRPVATLGGRGLGNPAWMGQHDQTHREQSRAVLVYTSEPVRDKRVLAGNAVADLFVDPGSVSLQLVARLSRVRADGTSVNLQDGVAVVDQTSAPQRVQITIGPLAAVIMPGECLRLTLAATDTPRWEPRGTGAAMHHVLHDATHPSQVTVPVVPG